MDELWRMIVSSVVGGGGTALAINILCKPRAVREALADRDLWHGRTLHLERMVIALLRGNRAEALRLLDEAKDPELMRAAAAASEKR
jgi:hypothetical protein